MSDPTALTRQIPLDGQIITHNGLTIRPVPGSGIIMLQRSSCVTDSEMGSLGNLFAQTFGSDLPLQVCQKAVSRDGAVTLLCISPESWVILCAEKDIGTISNWIRTTAGQATITASEMTDQYICIDIEGDYARALLAKGCALDLSDELFSGHSTARTLLSQANIIIWRISDDGFRILFDTSLCNYLWQWLESASEEFSTNSPMIKEN